MEEGKKYIQLEVDFKVSGLKTTRNRREKDYEAADPSAC